MDFLKPTFFIDHDHPEIQAYAIRHTRGSKSKNEKAIALFYQIRDEFSYWPYNIDLRLPSLKASSVLGKSKAYCAQKALLMVACLRLLGIEASLQFFNVRNHLGIGNLEKYLRTDLLVFHTGLQVKLNGKWLKLLPAFDSQLCKKLGVRPLEFDGKSDAFVQEFEGGNGSKKLFMEYQKDYGCFDDLPIDLLMNELQHYYPHIFNEPLPEGDLHFISHWDDKFIAKKTFK